MLKRALCRCLRLILIGILSGIILFIGNVCLNLFHYKLRAAKIYFSSKDRPIYFIPEPWELSDPNQMPYISNDLYKPYLQLPRLEHFSNVAILTVVRNAEVFLRRYGNAVSKLNYPHQYVSVFIGESDSTDKTVQEALRLTRLLREVHGFNDADVYVMNITGGIYGSGILRHQKEFQLVRRAHISLARNNLIEAVLKSGDFYYILWIDSDIEELPPDLIQQMLFAKSDLVTTPCYLREYNFKEKYDKNSWLETPESLKRQALLADDELILEGYGTTGRLYLPQMLSFGRIVPLDGVGGCALMVRTECFRRGLKFPERIYKHHIETEGLAKMARDLNFTVVGLPFVEVYHGHETAG